MGSPGDVTWLSVVLFRGIIVVLLFVVCELGAWLRRVKQEARNLGQNLTGLPTT
jgi:hypothetical protein